MMEEASLPSDKLIWRKSYAAPVDTAIAVGYGTSS